MRISDWSSDVFSSDLDEIARLEALDGQEINEAKKVLATEATRLARGDAAAAGAAETARRTFEEGGLADTLPTVDVPRVELEAGLRSEEHTSELQSLMRTSYAVFCLKKNNTT